MPTQNRFFLKAKAGLAIKASIPLKDVQEPVRYNCFFAAATPPEFSLSFASDTLDFDQIDLSREWLITADFAEQTVSVAAMVANLEPPCHVTLIGKEPVTHTQTRNYFRVDTSTRVAASSTVPEAMARDNEHWRLLGDTIDLSGSGLLCAFSEPLEKGTKSWIELTLPTRDMDIIKAFGHVVRCRKVEEGLYHIALHFDVIDSESQDKIMACCFELQRRYLRMRVRLENTVRPEQ